MIIGMKKTEYANLSDISNVAYNKFKDNLSSNGTYTVDERILNKSYQNIPLEFRYNSYLTMVAGAYKTGQIATFNEYGDIIDIGFSSVLDSDIIDPISIITDTVLFIKTSTGTQRHFLLAGSTLSINDYINNNKLICFCLKQYVPTDSRFTYYLNGKTNDVSKNNNFGIPNGDYEYMIGRKGISDQKECIKFNNAYLRSQRGWLANIGVASNIAFSFWIYSTDNTKEQTVVHILPGSGLFTTAKIQLNIGDTGTLHVYQTDQYFRVNHVKVSLPQNQWVHVAINIERLPGLYNQNKIWLNNVEQTVTNINLDDCQSMFIDNSMYVGNESNLNSSYVGRLQDFRVYTKLLSTNDILNLYNE